MNYKVAVKNVNGKEKEKWMTNYLKRQQSSVQIMLDETMDAIDLVDFKSLPEWEKYYLIEERKLLNRLNNLVKARVSSWEMSEKDE